MDNGMSQESRRRTNCRQTRLKPLLAFCLQLFQLLLLDVERFGWISVVV
jgi:hypothetical protein